jgi:hypothetical protein
VLAFQERLTLWGADAGVGAGLGVGFGDGWEFELELPPLPHAVKQNDIKNAIKQRIRASLRDVNCCKTTVLLML